MRKVINSNQYDNESKEKDVETNQKIPPEYGEIKIVEQCFFYVVYKFSRINWSWSSCALQLLDGNVMKCTFIIHEIILDTTHAQLQHFFKRVGAFGFGLVV